MSLYRRALGLSIGLFMSACGDDTQTSGGGGEDTRGESTTATTTSGAGGGGGSEGCRSAVECDDSNECTADTCTEGECSNILVQPDDNNACTKDACDPASGVTNTPIARDDMDLCTFDFCEPSIGPVHQGEVVLFSETFANNAAGWTLGADWQIGGAAASPPGQYGSADPAQDHTQLGDNGIAGVLIGANVSTVVDGTMAYLVSPAFDTTAIPAGASIELRLWRWANWDYTPFMTDTIEVYDGTQWVTLYSTEGNDEIILDSNVPGFGDGWFPMSFDVTSHSNPAFRVRFGSDVGDAAVYEIGGTNYDDISVVSVPFAIDDDPCTVVACDAVGGATFAPYVPADDGIACTVEVCDSVYGVRHQPDASACDDGDACTSDTCSATAGCVHSSVNTNDNNVCTVDSCDPVSGVVNLPLTLDDNDVCTADACHPVTGVTHALSGFQDTFETNKGWTFDTNWQRGPALAGCGDPASDHSPGTDNRVAGVVIGGCAPLVPVNASQFYCATSPVVNTTTIVTPTLSYWRHLWSDFAPFMKNKVEVWNGSAWVILWETLGSPPHQDSSWALQTFDLTAHSNPSLHVRFCYNIGSLGTASRGSWNLDDVSIAPLTCGL